MPSAQKRGLAGEHRHCHWVINVALPMHDQTLDNLVAGLVQVFATKHAGPKRTLGAAH
jgi:hypothetical protein